MALATDVDVVARLGRDIAPEEEDRVAGLLEEASIIVGAECPAAETSTDPVVPLVVSRMVALVLESAQVPPDVDSQTLTAGPFGVTRSFNSGASGGGPRLTKSDWRLLRKICPGAGGRYAFNVGMNPPI